MSNHTTHTNNILMIQEQDQEHQEEKPEQLSPYVSSSSAATTTVATHTPTPNTPTPTDTGSNGINNDNNLLYQPHTILLTGGAGFIGSNVLIYLTKKYPSYHFIVLDSLNPCASIHNLDEIKTHPNITFIHGDICNSILCIRLLRQYSIDTILHFAAQTHVDNSFGDSVTFTESNVLGTHVLLESVRCLNQQVKRFIHVSTDEVYGEANLNDQKYTTERALAPTNPYAATKTSAEYLVKSYHTSFHVPIIITRSNNVFGDKQYPEKLIPKFIMLLKQNQKCPVHGTGHNRRSYLYVYDVCTAFDVILHRGTIGKVYNIGSDVELENIEVLYKLIQLARKRNLLTHSHDEYYVEHVRDRAFNDFRYHIDSTILEHELGWTRQWNFDDALEKTMDWYIQIDAAHYWSNIDTALEAHPSFQPTQSLSGQVYVPIDVNVNTHDDDLRNNNISKNQVTNDEDRMIENDEKRMNGTGEEGLMPTINTHDSCHTIPMSSLQRSTTCPTHDHYHYTHTGMRSSSPIAPSISAFLLHNTCSSKHLLNAQNSNIDCFSTPRKWLIYNHGEWLTQHFIQQLKQIRPNDLIVYSQYDTQRRRGRHNEAIKQELQMMKPDLVICFQPTIDILDRSVHTDVDTYTDNTIHQTIYQSMALTLICVQSSIPFTYVSLQCTSSPSPSSSPSNPLHHITTKYTNELLQLLHNQILHVELSHCITDDSSPHNFIQHVMSDHHPLTSSNELIHVSILPDLLPVLIDMSIHLEVGYVELCNPQPISVSSIVEMYKTINDSTSPTHRMSDHNKESKRDHWSNGISSSLTRIFQYAPHLQSLSTEESIQQIIRQMKSNQVKRLVNSASSSAVDRMAADGQNSLNTTVL